MLQGSWEHCGPHRALGTKHGFMESRAGDGDSQLTEAEQIEPESHRVGQGRVAERGLLGMKARVWVS